MKADDQFWKRLTRSLTKIRRRKELRMWLSLILVLTILALLYSARHVAYLTLEIPWGIYLLVALCLGLLFLVQIAFDRL
jgi:hypothetical protein